MEDVFDILDRIGGENPPSMDELQAAKTELARLLKAEAGQAEPNLDDLQALRDGFNTVTGAIETEEARLAELQADVAGILDGVEIDDDDTADDPATADAATEDAEDAETGDPEDAEAKEPRSLLSVAEAANRVRGRAPVTQVVEPEPAVEQATADTKVFALGQEVDAASFSIADAGKVFERAMRSPNVGKQSYVRFDTLGSPEFTLPGTKEANTAMVDSFTSPEAVAAAGGCCSLPQPLRTQNVLSSQARPIRDSLPSLNVSEAGAVSFFPAICLPAGGTAVWTCDDDAAVIPGDDATYKECDFIECDDEQRVNVDAIYRCATIGNFARRFASEQWTGTLQAIMAQQARVAEAQLFAQMLAGATTQHPGVSTGSVFVNLIQSIQLAADTIRQDQRYTDVQLHLWAAGWLRGAIRSDLVAKRIVDAENPVIADQMIDAALGNVGVMVTWTPDVDTIEPGSQVDGGPLTEYPATATTLLAPDGYYTFLDGGQMDLGTEIRDHELNQQNSVAAFAESFEGVLPRGCNAKQIDVPVEVCDVAECPAPAA